MANSGGIVKMEWIADPVTVWVPGYLRWAREVHDAVGRRIQAHQDEIDGWMKANAPFQDITGTARASLHTDLTEYLYGYVLHFMYASPIRYWVYLEYDHQGKFAILEPAVNYWGPIILDDLQAMLNS